MKKSKLFLMILLAWLGTKTAQAIAPTTSQAQTTFNPTWVNSLGNPSIMGGDTRGNAVVTDANGNSYVTGYYTGTCDFDPGTGTANLLSNGSADLFIAKYDANGNYLWAKGFGGTGFDVSYSIALDANKNILITGTFSSTVDFDPGSGVANLSTIYAQEMFFAKYDSSCNYVWAKNIQGTSISVVPNFVTCTRNGSVEITGTYQGTLDFDPSTSVTSKTTLGSDDIFLVKYDASGNFVWVQSAGSNSNDKGKSLAIDNNGNTYLTGYYQATTTFSPTVSLACAGSADAFMAKYDSSGVLQYAKQIGGSGGDDGTSIKLDPANNIILYGFYNNTVDFDPNAGTSNLTTSGGNDLYIAKYTNTGNFIWAKSFGGSTSYDVSSALDVDASGNLVVTGNFNASADFDPSANAANLTPSGSSDIFVAKYDSTGNYVWANSLGGTSADVSTVVAFAPSGKIVVTGYITGTADFDPSAGTASLSISGPAGSINNAYLAGYSSSTGAYIYAGLIGNYPGTSDVTINSVKSDPSGNIIIAGSFSGQIDFDFSANTFNLSSAGADDIFFAKYDASGNFIWAKQMGGTMTDDYSSLEMDGNGNIYITGGFQLTADFDPSASTANLTSGGSYDIFLAKYNSSGNYIWAKKMGGNSLDRGSYLMLDANKNIILTGIFQTTVDFDPGAGTVNLTSAGSYDIFIAKYDSTGNYVWANKIGGTSSDAPSGIILDSNGNICTTGSFTGTVDFDPGAGTVNLTAVGATDIFFAQYDASGNYVSAFKVGGTGAESPYGLVKDSNGNFIITGYFSSTVDFDPTAGTSNLVSAGVFDIFLAKYSSTGSLVWANKMGGTANEYPKSLSINSSDNILITGVFAGTVDFDPSANTTANLTYLGGTDVFVAQYNSSGNYIAAGQLSGADSEYGNAIIYDASGNAIVAGNFKQTVDFDPNATSLNATATTGRQFGFFAKYQIVTCINPTAGGTIGTAQSGTSPFDPAAFTSSAAASGQTGTLEYKWQSSTTSSSAGFTDIASSNSQTYNAGPLTQTTWFKRLARVSCKTDWTGAAESNVLQVTVISCTPTSSSATSNACMSYTWNGNTYTTSGTYSWTGTNSGGCDSVATLNLTITPQPAQPSLACYQNASFNSTTCSWDVTGTQPVQPTLACYQTANFNNTTCSWNVTGTQPAQPTLACYETTSFNSTTCQWDVTGTQPAQPSTACYETASFNSTTCQWDVTGQQSAVPSLQCYETASFNTTTCQWDVTGTQPSQPSGLACYETASFNSTTCSWDVTGTQPVQPTLACYQTASFNSTTCQWDVSGYQPIWTTIYCYESATFNNTTCSWDVTGTQPVQPTLACYQTATFNNMTCSWTVSGTQPAQPTLACYETTSFNSTTCQWDVTGQQSAVPSLQCYETASFNTTTCQWDVTGTQPAQPSTACYETATFNSTTCSWDVTGTQPAQPTGLACYETASFNSTTCQWDVTGSPSAPVVTTASACSSYTWSVNNNTYTSSGTYSYFSNCQDYTLNLTIAPITSVTASATSSILCNGGNATINVTVTGGTAPYYGDGVQTVGAGTWSYTVSDDNGCTGVSNTVVLTEPAKLVVSASSTSASCGLSNGSVSSSVSGGASPYTYAWSGGGTSSTVNAVPANNYSVTVTDANGCTASASATVGSSGNVVGAPGALQGNAGACRGTTLTYSLPAISNATSYAWSLPSGATGSSTTNSITVTFSTSYNGGFICVTPSNSCGAGTQACINVPVITIKPSAPTSISGPLNPCGPGTYTYSVTPVNNASSYVWSVSSTAASITTGQGTNTIQITTSSGLASTQISVYASNCIGNSTSLTRTYYGAAIVSSPLTGNAYPCGGTTGTYSIDNIPGASSYAWSVSGNATISSQNGRSCTVAFAPNWTGGTLTATSINACGSTNRDYTLYNKPLQPGGVTGISTGLCQADGVNSASFSIAPVVGATSYAWTVPTGMQITANSGSTSNLSVTINSNFTGGNVCVTANNACGLGTARCLTTYSKPATPGPITGPTSVCKSQNGVSYSVSPVTGATYYSWGGTNGVSLTSQGTGLNALTSFIYATSNSAQVFVRSNNSCGTSSPSNLTVAVNASCRTIGEDVQDLFAVYPNPTAGLIRLTTPERSADVLVVLIGMDGRKVLQTIIPAYTTQTEIELTGIASGLYHLLYQDGEEVRSLKVMVQ